MNELFIVLVVSVVGIIAYRLGKDTGRKQGYKDGSNEKRKSWDKNTLPKDKDKNIK